MTSPASQTTGPEFLQPEGRASLIVATLAVTGVVVAMTQTLLVPLISALPELLNASVSDAAWVITATLLSGAISTPIGGRLADLYGKKRIMLLFSIPFVVGSVLCALSTSIWPMILGRGLQGLGTCIIPLGISLLHDTLPRDKVGGAMTDLTRGIGDFEGEVIPGYYRVTSAPTVVRGNVVVGGWVTDGQYWGETSGVVRAYDATTGEFAWAWDMGNPGVHTEPPEGETYTTSTPNSWAPMSADEELGLVYFPTGNATPDFYGPHRREFDDEFSSSVIAVNAETGELAWSFQTVHHDVWDYDVASQPTLVDLPGEGGAVRPALVQATKHGELYVLDRATGAPLFDVTETPVPQAGAVPAERLSPTQPRSNMLPSFRSAMLREADMWGISPIDQLYCRVQFAQARYEGHMTPPGLDNSIIFPATFGAVNWGSVSIHPEHGVMVVNHNRFASYMRLLTREVADEMRLAPQGPYGNSSEVGAAVPQARTEYAAYPQFWLTPLGIPCIAPPYGLISAVDLNSGQLLWSDRLGTSLGSGPSGFQFPFALPMGTPTHGGSLVTQSGLVFIGATADNFFRAFDLRTGEELWRYELPGGGSSTPISYTIDGRQYVAIVAAGQGAIRSRFSTKMVAFALPE